MNASKVAFAAVAAFLVISSATGAGPVAPTVAANGWDSSLFDYKRPAKMVIGQTTPTRDQVAFFRRPKQMDADTPKPTETGAAEPMHMKMADIVHLRFVDAEGQIVPALLCTPAGKDGPFPLVIATHGLTSGKAQVCGQVAGELVKRGFAVLGADMPSHGERPGQPMKDNPLVEFPLFQEAVIDVRELIDVAEQLPQVQTKGGVVLLGYSMGSWISSAAGPADPRVRAIVLMVGGGNPGNGSFGNEPKMAARNPALSMQKFAGRPVLMLNGRHDALVKPEMAKALYAALAEPKKQIWYDSGHLLPAAAYRDAAEWVAKLPAPATQAGN